MSTTTDCEDIFARDSSDLGKMGLLGDALDTGDCQPEKQPPCRVPPYQRELINRKLAELLATGRIEQSQSPWSSPVVLPRKHDSTYCMCTEYCKLSQLTKEDFMPLPQMDDVLGTLARVQEFCGPRFGLQLLANTSEIRGQA